jgi:two-component system response regulator (stage 0 sporulation protein F)
MIEYINDYGRVGQLIGKAQSREVFQLEKKKVLIVDDQNGIRVLLMEVFSSEGYNTFQASNGKLALEIVKNHAPDLVLLDMKIPGMDGLEILKHVKAIDRNIKVIMMTAYGELDMIKEATDLGALMHFTKPFDIDEMRIAVNMQLRGDSSTNRFAIGS